MKKLFFISLFIFLFSSCVEHDYRKVNTEGTYVTDIEHNGHKYLEFRERGQYGFSMVHNPECECFIDSINYK